MSKPFRRPEHWKMPLPDAATGFIPQRWTRQLRRASLRALEYLTVRREFHLPRRIARAIARVRANKRFRESQGAAK